jgi:lysine 2,3-aminomutase
MSSIIFKPVTTLREPAELAARGLVPVADIPSLEKVAARYAIAVTPEVAALIDPDDPLDPIARQYIPSAEELVVQPSEKPDPIGDEVRSPVSGIVHRYPDRVLFKLVHVCAVYCRFCFRREMVGPGKATTLSEGAYQNALAYIRAHPEVWEVILTGGDPLMLSPRRLSEVMADLARIDHVRIIRIHTRVPVAEPQRINDKMVAALKVKGATTWVALHANHVRELTPNARAACAAMIDAGIPMVSQSVLLRGVNDDPETLDHGDLAPGTSHLRTTLAQGQEIMRALRGRVSGLCQPDFVVDIPGGHGKSPAGPSYLSAEKSFSADREQSAETRYRIVDYCGDVHLYPPGP